MRKCDFDYNLEMISRENDKVLIDTCGFCWSKDALVSNEKEKIAKYKFKIKVFQFWKSFFENKEYSNKFFVPEMIFDEELSNFSHYKYSKVIKKNGGRNNTPGLLELRRKIDESQKVEKQLVYLLEEKRNILKLFPEDAILYNEFYSENEVLLEYVQKDFKFVGKEKLSGPDINFLFNGFFFASRGERVSLISADKGIRIASEIFSYQGKNRPGKVNFYCLKDVDCFEKINLRESKY
jgi:hypothetical protein